MSQFVVRFALSNTWDNYLQCLSETTEQDCEGLGEPGRPLLQTDNQCVVYHKTVKLKV